MGDQETDLKKSNNRLTVVDSWPVRRCHYCKDQGLPNDLFMLLAQQNHNEEFDWENRVGCVIEVNKRHRLRTGIVYESLGEFEILRKESDEILLTVLARAVETTIK